MEKFKVYINSKAIGVKVFTFSGGEVQVKVDPNRLKLGSNVCSIEAHVRSSDDIMTLMMLHDAIKREYSPKVMRLVMPYLPYARQDRVCARGEALALKVCTGLINSLKFDSVEIWDCHSDVGVALLDNCTNIPQMNFLVNCYELNEEIQQIDTVLVSPDAGAMKKTLDIAKRYGGKGVIRADKIRNTGTGEITGTEVYGDVKGKTCVIIDDIADGAFTFIKLAEKLKEAGALRVVLYVTHGIFSKGVDVVLEGGVDSIYTANYWPTEEHKDVNIIKV